MAEVAADAGTVDEGLLGRGLRVADATDIVDMLLQPVDHGENLGAAGLDLAELALGEAHQIVGRTEAARQQIGQDLGRKLGPGVLLRPGMEQRALAIVDDALILDRDLAGEAGPEPADARRRVLVADQIDGLIDQQSVGEDGLVGGTGRFDRDNDRGLVVEAIDERGDDLQLHGPAPCALGGTRFNATVAAMFRDGDDRILKVWPACAALRKGRHPRAGSRSRRDRGRARQ
jgi:hypothetical protein